MFLRRSGGFARPQKGKDEARINEEIRAREIRLIGPEGEQLGVFQTRDAVFKARDFGLDLVEISPNSTPPVCRIMDYGKYRYEINKKKQEAKKKQVVVHVKEIKFRPKTEKHDIEFKLNHIKRFLEEGDKVKLTIRFRGREMAYRVQGEILMQEILKQVAELSVVEQPSKLEGYTLSMILAPVKKK